MKLIDKRITKNEILTFIGIVVLITIILIIISYLKYSCPILKYLHLYCPGCGGTRMLNSFIKGDFYQSFRWNPLLFILLILLIFYFISFIFIFIKKKVLLVPSKNLIIMLIVLLLLFMLLRNIDLFSYLLPTKV